MLLWINVSSPIIVYKNIETISLISAIKWYNRSLLVLRSINSDALTIKHKFISYSKLVREFFSMIIVFQHSSLLFWALAFRLAFFIGFSFISASEGLVLIEQILGFLAILSHEAATRIVGVRWKLDRKLLLRGAISFSLRPSVPKPRVQVDLLSHRFDVFWIFLWMHS